jgi:putative aldouronate transport system permease protein
MHSTRTPRPASRHRANAFNVVNVGILGLFALVTIFPFYYVILMSFADAAQISKIPVYLLPTTFDLSSYKILLANVAILQGFLVSLFASTAGTAFNMLITVSAAYALSKKELPFRKALMGGIIFTMFFGGTLIPYYLTVKHLGLVNSLFVLVIPAGVNTFYLIIVKNYFQRVPASLEESAKIDGATDITILVRIIIPVSAAVMATFTLFYAVERWNDWWLAMMFISKPSLKPLQIVLREIINNVQNIKSTMGKVIAMQRKPINIQSLRMAIVVLTTIPILVVYPYMQKYFATGIMIGSIKG